jgi:endonuclease/exonuclease/phosphatase family metal-dependent hydrolase
MRINLLCVSIFYALSTVLTTVGDIPDVEAMNESSVTVMFWNLENFFDFRDDGKSESDAGFSATGERRWTKTRFYRKCQAIAKTILWAGSNKSDDVPDIVGVAEVENRFVLSQLVAKTALRKLDYEIVHFDSPDPRGIDCALLYRASRLTLVSAKPCHVSAPGLQTRDILMAQFVTLTGDSLAVLVNHHPSKYGGGETDWRREVAVARLRALGDSLAAAGWTRAVAVGDFNDTPDNPLFAHLAPAFSLCRMTDSETALDNGQKKPSSEGNATERTFTRNGSAPPARGTSRRELAAFPSEDSRQRYQGPPVDTFPLMENARSVALPSEDEPSLRGKGSIRFNGEWQLIDLCFVSPTLEGAASFSVLEPPFLTERDAAHSGDRPLRTYSGPRYLGGVSDHRPILVQIHSTHHPFSYTPNTPTLPYPSSLTNSHYARPHLHLLHHSPMCTLFTTSLTSSLPLCPSTLSSMSLLSLRSNTACAKESSKNRDFLYK